MSAPVVDKHTNKYIGFFDVSDFSDYVLQVIEHCESHAEEVPIEFCDLYDLLMTVGELHPKVLESVLHAINGEKFPSLPSGAPFKEVCFCYFNISQSLKVLERLGNKGFHRVAIVDSVSHNVTKIISQSVVMKFLVIYLNSYLTHFSMSTRH